MAIDKNIKESAGKGAKKKFKIFKFLSAVLVCIVVLIVLAPSIISTPAVTSIIKNKVAQAANAQVELNDLRVSWINGITLEGVSYSDASGIIVDAQKIYIKPRYLSLIGGVISVSQGIIENTTVTLVTDENNPKAGGDIAAKAAAAFIPKQSIYACAQSSPEFSIAKFNYIRDISLDLKNVRAVIEIIKKDGSRGSFDLSKIEGKIRLNPPGQTCGIELKGKSGDTGDINLYLLANRPQYVFLKDEFNSAVKFTVKQLDTSRLSPVLYLAGADTAVSGVIDFSLDTEIEKGLVKKCKCDLNSSEIDFNLPQSVNKIAIKELVSSVRLTTDKDFIRIKEIAVNSEWLNLSIDGLVPLSEEGIKTMFDASSSASLSAKFNARLSKALEQFPDFLGESGMTVRSGDIAGHVSTSNVGGGKVFYSNISLSNFSAANDEKTFKLNSPISFRSEIVAKPEGVQIDPIEISSVFMNLSCSGMVDDLKIQGVIPLKTAQNELGDFINFGPYKYSGEIIINGDMMPKSRILNGTAFLKDFNVINKEGKSISEPYADLSFGLKHDTIENRLWLTSMFFKSTVLGEFELLQGFVNLREDVQEKFVAMFKYRTNIAKVLDFLSLYDMKPKDFDASGQFSTTARVVSANDKITVVSDDTGIAGFYLKSGQSSYNTANLKMALNAVIDQANGVYNASNLAIQNDWCELIFSKCNYAADKDKNSLEADFTLSYDLETMAKSENFIPEGMTIAGKRKSVCHVKTSFPSDDSSKALPNLEASLGIGFDSIQYKGFNFGKADIKANAKDGKLVIAPFAVPVNEGAVNFGGTIDILSDPLVLTIDGDTQLIQAVKINDELSNGLLQFINPVFAGSVNTTGQIDLLSRKFVIPFSADAAGGLKADTKLAVTNVTVTPSGLLGDILSIAGVSGYDRASLTIEPTDIKVEDKRVSYDSMVMLVGKQKLTFGGGITFDGGIDMDVAVPYSFSMGEKKYSEVTLPIDGNLAAPRIDTRKLLEKNTESVKTVIDAAIDKNLDEDTGKLIKEGIRGLQDLLNKK